MSKKEGVESGAVEAGEKPMTAKSQALRERIQAQFDKAAEAHRQELFRHRIDLARGGVRSYTLRRVPEAVKAFHTYLRILEDWKKVPEGGLAPSQFDPKDDAAELLLISGVYWDLVKLYDRTKSPEKYSEFMGYIDKYVEFTEGQNFKPLAAETVRKYLVADKPVHKKEFKELYRRLAGSNCFVATALVDVQAVNTTPTLRLWRDHILMASPIGRLIVFIYTDLRAGVLLAEISDRLPLSMRKLLGQCLDRLAEHIRPKLS